ncbi:MAG: hypothetical protein GF398_01560 [Chitinivibrionales bacterium]|nr:hypothetical protein [Chitinivibrionales bacterium]
MNHVHENCNSDSIEYYPHRNHILTQRIYADITLVTLDADRIGSLLTMYRNPRFIAFVEGYLNDRL